MLHCYANTMTNISSKFVTLGRHMEHSLALWMLPQHTMPHSGGPPAPC